MEDVFDEIDDEAWEVESEDKWLADQDDDYDWASPSDMGSQ